MLPLVRIYIHKQGDAVFVATAAGAAQGGGKTVRPVGRIVAEHRGRSSIRKGGKTQSQDGSGPEGEVSIEVPVKEGLERGSAGAA